MEAHRTEEEQIEAIKAWWKTNGNNILLGIVLAVVIVVGWQLWQDQKRATGEAASTLFAELTQASQLVLQSSAKPGEEKQTADIATLMHLAGELKEQHESSEYAVFAALVLAKHQVLMGDADKAEAELRWALEHKPNHPVELIATLRLARVLSLKKQYDEALSLVSSVDAGAQSGAYETVKGDILYAQGKTIEAREAYGKAMPLLSDQNERLIVKMKYDNLAVANKAVVNEAVVNEAVVNEAVVNEAVVNEAVVNE